MLRLIVWVLLVLNLGYYAWGQGWLLAYGWGPTQQHEPQRLAQQVHPEALTILTDTPSDPHAGASAPDAAASEAPAEPVATTCWQATELDETQAETLRPLLAAKLTQNAWVLDESRLPARWMVYMGPFTNPTDLAKKREQLTTLKVKFYPLASTSASPGLSLGVFSSEEAAKTGLQDLTKHGVRSARVLQERPASVSYRLRLPAISAADQAALDSIKAALPGKTLEVCPEPAAGSPANAASSPAASASH